MSAPALALRDLVKTFGPVRALDGLDLEVQPGEVHGFLGPNGAGKSTAIRVLLGVLRADSGHAELLGGDPWRDAARLHRRLAYVPGDVSLWPGLTGGETVDVLGELRGGLDRGRRDAYAERFGLDLSRRAGTYSKGNRQKVALVAALASDAELLLLDEPTSGLDPLKEAEFQACVGELREQGRTVLLSSHILSEVEALCDRVTILREGRTVQSGSLAQMRHLTRTTLTVTTAGPVDGLGSHPGVHDLEVGPAGQVRLAVDDEALDDVVRLLSAAGVRGLHAEPPTLEELFLRHYGDPA